MKIVEIFKSIQGESTYAGSICTFIRLTGCNLRCSWCDTTYSYYEGKETSINDIIDKINSLDCKLVEITGGEPLVQEDELLLLIDQLIVRNYKILLETNGSFPLDKIPSEVCKIMDIKLPSSGMFDKFHSENLEYLTTNDQIKFVVNDWSDYETMCSLIEKYDLSKKCRLLLSKTGNTNLTHRELADRLISDNLPVRYQLQLHKIIWQDERGK